MDRQEEELVCSIPDQHLPCFLSFLDIFKGLPFYFENYPLESVSYLINLFGLSSLSQFVSENIPHPQTIHEALDFLSKTSCEFYPKVFHESLTILIDNFATIKTKQFLKLSNYVLESLLQSPQFQVENKYFFFI
jgi:hypothetical protein